MLNEMKQIALDYLFNELNENQDTEESLLDWYNKTINDKPEILTSYFVESVSGIEKVYIIEPDENDFDLVNLTVEDITEKNIDCLPFIKPTGSQSGQIGPVIKRSFVANAAGPSNKILKTTKKNWDIIAKIDSDIATYFNDILKIMGRKKINILNERVLHIEGSNNMLNIAIQALDYKKTSIVAIKNSKGELPGQSKVYSEYLQKIGSSKYITGDAPSKENHNCSLCNKMNTTVFPNGVKGAGINVGNVDREGSFSELNITNAYKNYAICQTCADLLYVYKNHVLKTNSITKKRMYQTYIAGEKALIVPSIANDPVNRQKIMVRMKATVGKMETDTETAERRLWNILKEEKAILNINIYWLKIGQNIEDLQGSVTDVPPSRLRELSQFNEETLDWDSAIFPNFKDNEMGDIDLSLFGLKKLFKRPGGDKAKKINASQNLFRLRRDIAQSLYHKRKMNEKRFWEEIMITAVWYLKEIATTENSKKPWKRIIYEEKNYITYAGWIRHLAFWQYYLKQTGVMKMDKKPYEPKTEILKPYFSEESGIDSIEKAFAFTLGILYGRLLTLQGAKGINVGANALTWLKRLTLKGKDLPELYVKTREKLLAYEAETKKEVREVIKELGNLGNILGDSIQLDAIPTNYFLLLGQSVSSEVIPSTEKQGDSK